MHKRFLADYGMVLVLLALCVLFSLLTLKQQTPEGRGGVTQVMDAITASCDKKDVILAVGWPWFSRLPVGRKRTPGRNPKGRSV